MKKLYLLTLIITSFIAPTVESKEVIAYLKEADISNICSPGSSVHCYAENRKIDFISDQIVQPGDILTIKFEVTSLGMIANGFKDVYQMPTAISRSYFIGLRAKDVTFKYFNVTDVNQIIVQIPDDADRIQLIFKMEDQINNTAYFLNNHSKYYSLPFFKGE